jgi:hypothetical protein
LRNPSLNENERTIEIEKVQEAARDKLNKLGSAPKDSPAGAMVP